MINHFSAGIISDFVSARDIELKMTVTDRSEFPATGRSFQSSYVLTQSSFPAGHSLGTSLTNRSILKPSLTSRTVDKSVDIEGVESVSQSFSGWPVQNRLEGTSG